MEIPQAVRDYLTESNSKPLEERVAVYNEVARLLKAMVGIDHPALAVQLVKTEDVQPNDYNPNKVAPPEMKLLKLSIAKDGVTMPVVAARDGEGRYVVIDGFHRTRVIQETPAIRESLRGYIPLVELNKAVDDRITSTVRHNLARGSHQTELSARLVVLLKKHNWSDKRIGKELGMEPDEVLRLKQLTGLAEAFADREFSKAWV